jgi:hypothetical protein
MLAKSIKFNINFDDRRWTHLEKKQHKKKQQNLSKDFVALT